MFKKIFLFVAMSIFGLGILAGVNGNALADQGCPNAQTRRATLLNSSYGTYKTCALTLCSTYPGWHKSKTYFNFNTMQYEYEYNYSIQGGSYVGLPACRAEIDQSAGWVYTGQ